jgi:hypothetical protein
MTTLTRRQTLIGAAATVAAAALPAVAVAGPPEEIVVLRMTPEGCRHIVNVPWIGYGVTSEPIEYGHMFLTKLGGEHREVWVMADAVDEHDEVA